jgi:acetyl esterase/lipase
MRCLPTLHYLHHLFAAAAWRRLIAATLSVALLSAASTSAGAAPAAPAAPSAPAASTAYAYGAAPLQQLDYAHPAGAGPAPLIVFVHGGGWQRGDKASATGPHQVAHWTGDGYAFASINYRLVPNATAEQQAADVAAAIAWLRSNAARLGIDTTRIVLMGHSAGAHLVALVGTDPQYLAAAGITLSDLRGVIALDGAAYDVARQMADSGRLMRSTYLAAFGTDAARQRQLSPTLQAHAPNAPAFLLAHVDRADGKTQAEALGAALRQAGTPVQVASVDGKGLRGHMEINRLLGNADYPGTAVVDDWLRGLLQPGAAR